jgi:multiple sugar transport system substrate-binding protein
MSRNLLIFFDSRLTAYNPNNLCIGIMLLFHRWFQILLSLALVWLLTACSTPPTNGVVKLTLWQGVNPPSNRAVLQKLVDKFNQQHPQIQVESLYVGQSDQQLPKILAAAIGDASPDLLWYGPMLTGQLVDLGAIKPIDEFWQKSPVAVDIDPALLGAMRYQNQLWSVPFATNNLGIFYRPDLFKAAGITKLPQTWAELQATAKKLTNQDHQGIILPLGKGEWTVFSWLPFMWSGGGSLDQSPIQLNNVGAIQALQFWRSLLDDRSAILSTPERGYELDKFLAGKVAMQITGPWTLGQLAGTKSPYGVMPIPAGQTARTVVGGEHLFMMKTTPDRSAAAWEFMEYVLSADFQTAWAIGTGYLPVNLQARQSPEYRAYVAKTPGLQVFLDQAGVGKSRPISPGYPEISELLGRSIESVLLGKETPEKALANAQNRLDLTISR